MSQENIKSPIKLDKKRKINIKDVLQEKQLSLENPAKEFLILKNKLIARSTSINYWIKC